MAESSPKATPKRKRDELIFEQRLSSSLPSIPATSYITKTIFSFEPPTVETPEDGNSSPRTKVAQKFRDLAIGSGSGGGVVTTTDPGDSASKEHGAQISRPQYSPKPVVFDFDGAGSRGSSQEEKMEIDDDDGSAARKRMKVPAIQFDTGSSIRGESSAEAAGPVQIDGDGKLMLIPDVSHVNTLKGLEDGKLQKSYPSINRLSDSKSRRRGRTGTPPIGSKRKPSGPSLEEPVIVDPVRAALTWHEEEITVYDSEDKDDDGTGLNGIGFKPTAAVAHARAQKRRQQLNEYRKREENDARARRNQRRREQLGDTGGLERKHSMARVRFSDTEPSSVVTT